MAPVATRRSSGKAARVTVLAVLMTLALGYSSEGGAGADVRDVCGGPGAVVSSSSPAVGDVSGDRRSDRVAVAHRPQFGRARPRCLYTLEVTMNGRRLTVPLREDRAEFRSWNSSDRPVVRALVDLSGQRGLEIVVEVGSSASRDYVVVYLLRGTTLRRLRLPEPDERYPDSFGYGSSLGSGQSGVGCADRPGSGAIVQTSLSRDSSGRGVRLQRRVLRVDGWSLRPQRGESRLLSEREAAALDLPELAAWGTAFGGLAPFPNCAYVVVR